MPHPLVASLAVFDPASGLVPPLAHLDKFASAVADLTIKNLETVRAAGAMAPPKDWEAHDAAFGPFNVLVEPAWKTGLAIWAIHVWRDLIEDRVAAFEAANGRIHKGAPLANTALLYFMAGDYPRATQYFEAADLENLATHNARHGLLVGQGFSHRVLVAPLLKGLGASLGTDYATVVGQVMSDAEVEIVVKYCARRVEDGMLLLSGIWTAVGQLAGPQNEASRHQFVRAVADLLIVLESTIRKWHPATGTGELYNRLDKLLGGNAVAHDAFKKAEVRHAGKDLKDPAVFNGMWTAESKEFDNAGSHAARIGIAAYMCARLRNALLHGLDQSLVVYADPSAMVRAASLAVALTRVCAIAEAGGLAAL